MVLESLDDSTSEPPPVEPHYVLLIFAFIGVANAQAQWWQGRFRILPQFWPLSHGNGILKSIKREPLCGDVRKHPRYTFRIGCCYTTLISRISSCWIAPT